MSETSPPWNDLSPWTEASTKVEICQRSFSGWGFVCNECLCAPRDDWYLWSFCHMVHAVRMRHLLHRLINSLPLLSAEPLRQHQKRALQNPRGRWEWSDTHVLQPRQRRLAIKARYEKVTLIVLIYIGRASASLSWALFFSAANVSFVRVQLVYDGISGGHVGGWQILGNNVWKFLTVWLSLILIKLKVC